MGRRVVAHSALLYVPVGVVLVLVHSRRSATNAQYVTCLVDEVIIYFVRLLAGVELDVARAWDRIIPWK